jgi:hypothetical protein
MISGNKAKSGSKCLPSIVFQSRPWPYCLHVLLLPSCVAVLCDQNKMLPPSLYFLSQMQANFSWGCRSHVCVL